MKFTKEILIKMLHDRLEKKDQNNVKYFFTVKVSNELDQKSEMPIVVERETGVDTFDEAINTAKEYSPDSIHVILYKNKTETDRKAEKHVITLTNIDPEEQRQQAETTILSALDDKIKETLAGLEANIDDSKDGPTLGLLKAEYRHTAHLLETKSNEEMTKFRHEREVDDLNRIIIEKEEQHAQDDEEIDELESEVDELTKKLDHLEENRFSFQGLDGKKLLGELGSNVVTSFIKKNTDVVAQLSGVPAEAILSALEPNTQAPPQNNGGGRATMVENENPAIDEFLAFVRNYISTLDKPNQQKFGQLMAVLSQDVNNLDVILKVVLPNSNEE